MVNVVDMVVVDEEVDVVVLVLVANVLVVWENE